MTIVHKPQHHPEASISPPPLQPSITTMKQSPRRSTWRSLLATFGTALGLLTASSAAYAQQDLIIVRSMPAASGTTGSTITYEIAYKNGGPGAANGTSIAEQLPNGFYVANLSCVGAFGGAVCPSTTILNNDPLNYPYPRIEGNIATFPEFAVVRLRVQMRLSASPGNYVLSGTIAGPDADPIANTNEVLSSLYVRPLLMDLATSHSSTLPAIGGSNGLGGTSNVTFDGNTIASNMPLSISYRLDNHGPDTAPGGSFVWQVGNDNFGSWVTTSWTQANYGSPVGYVAYSYSETDPNTGITYTEVHYEDAQITPYACTAVGAATCPAPVLYKIGGYYGAGWLARAPQVTARTIIGNTIPNSYYYDPYTWEVASADITEARQNRDPLFGQNLPAGAGLILTATLNNPSYGSGPLGIYDPVTDMYTLSYSQRDGMFTQTDQLTTTRCQANPTETLYLNSAISYTDPNTGMPLSSVSDNDLGNNEWNSQVGLTRTCPQADIVVTTQSLVNGAGGNQVYDGNTYAMSYTITNNGPSNVSGVEVQPWVYVGGSSQGGTFTSALNWIGHTRTISCTSSDPGSPCPSQAQLDAWMTSNSNTSFGSPLASGATWTIVVGGQAGTTACSTTTSYNSRYWLGNLQAWGVAMADPNEGNNYATSANATRQLSFIPQPCPGLVPDFTLQATKTAAAATTAATAVNVGDYVYFTVRLQNTSASGINLKNVQFQDYLSDRRYWPNTSTYASVDNNAPGPFQREAAQPAGLNVQVSAYNPVTGVNENLTFPSGIVCTAYGTAQCPTANLNGYSNSLTAAQSGSYGQFNGVIPLLPAGAGNYIELLVPWRAQPDANGCAPSPNTGRYNVNVANLSISGDTIAVLPDSSEVLANSLRYNSGSGSAIVYNNLPTCPTGTPNGTIAKTLRDHGTGTVSGTGTTYNAELAGNTLVHDVVLTSTGSIGMNRYRFSDNMGVVCRDGIDSNPSGNPGSERCGKVTLTSITCSATGSAVCPSTTELADVVSQLATSSQPYINLVVGDVGNYATPALPVGDSVTFTTTHTVEGINSFTGSFSNWGQLMGWAGASYFNPITRYTYLNLPHAPGISIAKDVDKLQAGEGEAVTYTIDITNGGNGPLPAGATFTDPLPAGLTAFTSVTCTGLPGPAALPDNGPGVCPATITNNASGISATLPEMLPNTTLRFTITANAPAGGVITSVGNEASVTIPTGAAQATLLASANFAIPSAQESQQASPLRGYKSVINSTSGGDSVLPGETLTYTISYANTGGMDIANFQITDSLPSYVTYSGGATLSTVGPISTGTINPSFNGTTVTTLLQPGAILGGAGAIIITLPVTVNADVPTNTVILNQAFATGSGVTGTTGTDNVDNTNPACPATSPSPCLPTGVSVPSGSVPQYQFATVDPVHVGVGARAPNPYTPPLPVPTSSQGLLGMISLLLMGLAAMAINRRQRHYYGR